MRKMMLAVVILAVYCGLFGCGDKDNKSTESVSYTIEAKEKDFGMDLTETTGEEQGTDKSGIVFNDKVTEAEGNKELASEGDNESVPESSISNEPSSNGDITDESSGAVEESSTIIEMPLETMDSGIWKSIEEKNEAEAQAGLEVMRAYIESSMADEKNNPQGGK